MCLGDRTRVLRDTRLEGSRRHHRQGLRGQVEMVDPETLGPNGVNIPQWTVSQVMT